MSLWRQEVAYELSVPFAKVGVQQADNVSSNPPQFFHKKTLFLLKFLIEMYNIVIANYLFKISWLYPCTQGDKTHEKYV